jgi:NAD(P)-dependent dehydrogenase (short-subunit alcohol dehydrogenase family)
MSFNQKKIALITGGAIRIGKELALSLAKDGWSIAIHYNSSVTEAKLLAETIDNQTIDDQFSFTIQADFNNPDEVSQIIPYINENFGNVDLLINNAC